MYRIIFLFSILIFFSACTSIPKQDACHQKWGVVEYGSSRVKLHIAEVNLCERKVLRDVYKVDWAVESEQEIKKQKDRFLVLNPKINLRMIEVTKEIRLNLVRFKTNKTFGIATGIYRSLLDPKSVLDEYAKVLGGKIDLLSNEDEARVGLSSIVAKENPKDKFVVWDFGGNNMQFTIVNGQSTHPILGYPGSSLIRNSIAKLLGKKTTPNPITQKKRQLVEGHILTHSFKKLNSQIFPQDASIFGIGAVHARSVGGNIETMLGLPIQDRTYTIEQVNSLAQKFVDLNDSEVGGRYPESQATNILTVHALMRKMGWKQVTFSDETLTLGYMVQVLTQAP